MAAKTVKLDVSIWYNARTGHIHIAARDRRFISTVSADPDSARSHPHLFRKLAKYLRDAGAPAPERETA